MRDSAMASRGDTGAVRVLLFNGCKEAAFRDVSDYGHTMKVVGTARNAGEVLSRAAATKPDVILMVTDYASPTADFARSLRDLNMASLTGRVAIMAKHPARYLRLAVRTGAAALLPLNARYDDVINGVNERNGSSGRSGTSCHLRNDGGNRGPDREVTDM